MSATPIPRTLSMTIFGDLDISTIRQQPPGRNPARTYLVEPHEQAKSFEFVRKKLSEGRQAYVICPLVDRSEHIAARSAEQMVTQLRAGPLAKCRIGLVHGRMDDEERDTAMEAFRTGTIQVLVSTLVVEVGIDVPNATVMVIMDAERFGLSQLHQLRGRISRGSYPGFCFLFTTTDNPQSAARLQVVANTSDGFLIADEDLKLRGPGEFVGTRQHGLPELRIGDLIRDAELIRTARDDAHRMIATDPRLELPEHALLRETMVRRLGAQMDLASAG
jgi:ATP-dependent DNA helicase RecG